MRRFGRHRLVIVGVALAFAAGGGAAYPASQPSSNPRGAFLSDVAKRLNVSPERLRSAIQAAVIDRLNAAVKAGRLTRAQANAIKQRIEKSGAPPLWFGPGRGEFAHPPGFFAHPPGFFAHPPGFFAGPPPFGHAGPLAAAASYLGLTELQLFNELRSGHSLAQIARAHGKSVSGLRPAITAALKSRLDQAVTAGQITNSQEQLLLAKLSSRLAYLINRTPPSFGPERGGPPAPWAHPAPIPPF